MHKILKYLKGYITMELKGYAPERFMNLCNHNNISLWDVNKTGEGYRFNILKNDYIRSKNFFEKTKTEAVVQDKVGLPFLIRKYIPRYIFFIGLLICLFLLGGSTLFIWDFKIEGNYSITYDMYRNFLEQENISYGTPKNTVDLEKLEESIRNTYSFITWASFELDGTKLKLKVKESNEEISDKTILENQGYDLCSTVSGNVISMVTRKGVPMVCKGDDIAKGQLLVSGLIPIVSDDELVVAYNQTVADADVYVAFHEKYQIFQPYNHKYKIYTNRYHKNILFGIGKRIFKIGNACNLKDYDQIGCSKNLSKNNLWGFPIFFVLYQNAEYVYSEKMYTKDECIHILAGKYADYCETLREKGLKIVEKNVKIEYYKNGVNMSIELLLCKKDGILVPVNLND